MSKEIAFVILIGGMSKRFGIDKGLMKISGKSFIEHQVRILEKFSKKIFLSAHDENQIQEYKDALELFDNISFILDDTDDKLNTKRIRGPLLGIYSALKYLRKTNLKKAFIISCDLPLIKSAVL